MEQVVREEQINLPADLSELDRIAGTTEQLMEGAPARTVKAVQVSIEELFVNIYSYAYGEDYQGEKFCSISWRREEQDGEAKIVVCIKDKGKPFDPVAKEDPDITLSLENRGVGGMGVLMVKRYMDRVSYEYKDNQNVVTLEKAWQMA